MPLSRNLFRRWNIFLLYIFGATINYKANIYSSARIYDPSNKNVEANNQIPKFEANIDDLRRNYLKIRVLIAWH